MFWLIHGIHLLAAATVVGGTLVLRFFVLPKLSDDEKGREFLKAILSRWRPVVWGNIVLITVTGLANAHQSYLAVGNNFRYWTLFLVKFFAAMTMFGIALMMTLPMEGLSKVQENRKRWLRHIVELGTIIIFISAYLRYMHAALPGG